MANHVIRDRLWESRKLERCSDGAAAWYPWIFLVCDDHGRFEYHPRAIWMCVFRRRPSVTQKDVENWLSEYEREGLLIRYHINGELAFWTGFEGRKPSERRPTDYPDPLTFPEVKKRLRELGLDSQGGGRAATKPRKSRDKAAEASPQNRGSSDQIRSDQIGADQSGSDPTPDEPAFPSQRAADIYRRHRPGNPPKPYFPPLRRLVTKFGWPTVEPEIDAYLQLAPLDYENFAGKFEPGFGGWVAKLTEKKAPIRASPGSVDSRNTDALRRAMERRSNAGVGEGDGVSGGAGTDRQSLSAGSGRSNA